MRYLKILIIVTCFTCVGSIVSAQTWNRVFNLDLSSRENWDFRFSNLALLVCEPDTALALNGKHPLHIFGDKIVDEGPNGKFEFRLPLDFQMCGHVLLPAAPAGSKCELTAVVRADTLSAPIYLDAEVIDRNERVISTGRSSIVCARGVWQEHTVPLHGLAGSNELRIILRYKGATKDREELWIDRFIIRIDGEDIGEWDVAERLTDAPTVLDPKYTVPLDFGNEKADMASRISGLAKQRFVTLSASTCGSRSVQQAQLRVCRDLILKHGVGYLIFEADMISMLALDLYVNGYNIDNIDSYLNYYGAKDPYAGPEFLRFVEWLREYNTTGKHRVHLFGTDYTTGRYNQFLSDLIPRDKTIQGIGRMAVVRRLQEDDNLQKALRSDMLGILINTIECLDFMWTHFGYSDPVRTKKIFRYITNLDENIIPRKGRAAIIANCDHLTYIPSFDKPLGADSDYTVGDPYWDTAELGRMMREKYGSDYFSVAFLAGTGASLQDNYPEEIGQFASTLPAPVVGSVEDAAMKTGLEYLYYPSARLDDHAVYMADIGRAGRYRHHYRLAALRDRHDGYIFVRNNRPKEVVSPDDYTGWETPRAIKLFYFYKSRIMSNDFGLSHPKK